MEASFTTLNRIIQRQNKIYIKEKKADFYPKFKKAFMELGKIIACLSNVASLEDFEQFLSPKKTISAKFIGNPEELIKLRNVIEELKELLFNSYDILRIIGILLKYLKDDEKNQKLDALMQILERLIII